MPDTLAAQQILVDAQGRVLDERRQMLDEGRGAELIELMKLGDGFQLVEDALEHLSEAQL